MNKRHLHHAWTKVRPIKPQYLLAASIVFSGVFVVAARANNYEMIRLREEVYRADRENSDVEAALRNLREHVHSHMNTDLTPHKDSVYPPIQLVHQYQRLVQEQKSNSDGVYAEAERRCEAQFPAGRLANGRVQCVQEYIENNSVAPQTIPESLYKFDFISPVWSPDVAGWSLVFAVLLFILAAVRFIGERLVKKNLS